MVLSAWIKHNAPRRSRVKFCQLCGTLFHHPQLHKTSCLLWRQLTSCHDVSCFCIISLQMECKILLDLYLSLTRVTCLILSHREVIYSYLAPLLIHLNRMCSMFLPHDFENRTLPFKKILISFPFWVGYDIIYFKSLK